jgi:AcrR family transcriptional regulator
MSSQVSVPMSEAAPRQWISPKQAETVQSLVEAALDELRAGGYEGLTVRNVARRAGVAPATAYNYFSSKDHLVAEVFSRRLQGLAEPASDDRWTPAERVAAALDEFARHVSAEPALAQACTVAMLGTDPEVRRLREQIGAQMHHRVATAAGDTVDPGAVAAIDLIVAGALVNAGMGHMGYDDLGSVLADATARVLAGGA